MSTYALTLGSIQTLGALLKTGGQEILLLQRPANDLRCTLIVEPSADKLEAIVSVGPARHSLKLNARDTANAQHLADFVEQIANGVADTAGQPPLKLGVFDRMVGTADHVADTSDMVNHPPHYTGHPSGVECIEVAEHLPFCLGNAFKYLFRRGHKGALRQDLEKALWYIRREQAARSAGAPLYMIADEAALPLARIVAAERAPWRHIMEMVGSGRMLDLAERLLVDQIAGMAA